MAAGIGIMTLLIIVAGAVANFIMISTKLSRYDYLEKEVVVIGSFDRVEIWNAQRWAEKVATYMTPAKMKSLARKVRL